MISAILTDIEGTTSSISFVKDVLFPYARKNLPDFLRKHESSPEVAVLLDEIRSETGLDSSLDSIIELLQQWIDEDRKHGALKSLQGIIWKRGYQEKAYVGHIYADAYNALVKWRASGVPVYIYSSGSVAAQKLLFAHTEYGDVNDLFSGNFDTRIGNKKEADSYSRIAHQINVPGEQILFLSDITDELDAASTAGLQTMQLVRPEDGTEASSHHSSVSNFSEIKPESL